MTIKFKDLNDGEVTVIKASTLEDAFNQACGLFGTEYVCDCMEIVLAKTQRPRLRRLTSKANSSQ